MKSFSSMFAASIVSAAFLTGSAALGVGAYAQSMNSDEIIGSLKPKKQLTRSLTPGKKVDPQDKQFLEALPTRGIRIDQRKKLDEIVEKQELPSIDIEISFDFNSAQIRPDSLPDVSELGKALSSDALAKSRIVLNGHTDAKGSNEYNQNLSDQRAAAVRDFLIENFGISADRLIAIGYGEERLKNASDPEAAENRRVEVINLTSS